MPVGNREINVTGATHTRFIMRAPARSSDVTWLKYDAAVGLYPKAFVIEELPGSGAFRIEMHRGRRNPDQVAHPAVPSLFAVTWSPWAQWDIVSGWNQGQGYVTEWSIGSYPTTSAEEGFHDTMSVMLFATGSKEAKVAFMVAPGS